MSEFFNYFSILKKFLSNSFIKAGVLPWFLGVALITFSFASDNFLTTQNILGVARHSSDLILVAMAQMVVMLTAGLDFSVGVILAMTSVVASMTMVALWSGYGSGWEAIFIGCLAGSSSWSVYWSSQWPWCCFFTSSSLHNDSWHVFNYIWVSSYYYWRNSNLWNALNHSRIFLAMARF